MFLLWDFLEVRKDGTRTRTCGADDRAYPRLKDAVIEDDDYPVLYNQVLQDMRIMYHECRLVHADLSEFNLLYLP